MGPLAGSGATITFLTRVRSSDWFWSCSAATLRLSSAISSACRTSFSVAAYPILGGVGMEGYR